MTWSSHDVSSLTTVERHGPVGWLINNRPDQLNAMNAAMRDEFARPGRSSTTTPRCGSSCTPARAGPSRPASTSPRSPATAWAWSATGSRWRTFDLHFTAWHQQVWKPVITAVNGICAGGGFHWVADADIVIAASDAQFFDPHVSVGQVVADRGHRADPQDAGRGGHAHGVRRPLRADVGASAAYELGMISQVVDPPERLREEAQALAETIARNSPAAMAATKRALWGALESGLTDACRAGAASWCRCGATPTRRRARRLRRDGRGHQDGDGPATRLVAADAARR